MSGGSSLDAFRVVTRIGVGSYGIVDEGAGPNNESVAIKKELTSKKVTRPTLEHEYHIYQALAGHDCIPNVKAYGCQDRFNVMVMDLLGPSLGDRFRECANQFSLGTTARLALGMLDAIDYMHFRGFIHRDIKPDNFLLGRGIKSQVVHLIDFGLTRRWRYSGASSTDEGAVDAIGTLSFASINAHLGNVQTRRDDLHSLAYTIILFARGRLPWGDIREGTRKHVARRVLEKKRSWTAARLCQDLPRELEAFSNYCFGLQIDEEPDYHYLRDKLTSIAVGGGWNVSTKFEWEEPGWMSHAFGPLPAYSESHLNGEHTAAEAPKFDYPLRKRTPGRTPCVKRGDVVLLKINPEKSLDYEAPPRSFDPSFFPHQVPAGTDSQLPYRPAVVLGVTSQDIDATYFNVEVYPLTRRSNVERLSSRRREFFLPVESLVESDTQMPVSFKDIFIYRTTLFGTFMIEYEQATISQVSLPEEILAGLEAVLKDFPTPYSLVYDSDDEMTRTILQSLPKTWYMYPYVMEMQPCCVADLSGETASDFSGTNGWIPEMVSIEKVRDLENGEYGSDDSEDEDLGTDVCYYDFPRSVNRRLSCTIKMASEAN